MELRRLANAEGDLSEALEVAANQVLDQARKRALRLVPQTVTVQSPRGDPAEAIIDAVRRNKAMSLSKTQTRQYR